MEFLKLIGICLCAAGAAILLSQYKKEYAAAISFGVGCIILMAAINTFVPEISDFISQIKNMGIESRYLLVAVKAVAIGYISQFAADTCRDFGQSAIAAKAELVGKISIFLISVPVLKDLFEMILQIMK